MAISSSCGALDNIVVDTIDTAQKCVTFLKEQNIGVATFIGLDKVNIKLCGGIQLFSDKTHSLLISLLFLIPSHLLRSDEGVGEEHGSHPHSRKQPSPL